MTRATLVLLVALTVVSGCASSTPMISDEEHCARFGGVWELDACHGPGDGGSM